METEVTPLSAGKEAAIREWLRYVVENDVNLMHFGPVRPDGRSWGQTEIAGLFAALDAAREKLNQIRTIVQHGEDMPEDWDAIRTILNVVQGQRAAQLPSHHSRTLR